MTMQTTTWQPGVLASLGSALLIGASWPRLNPGEMKWLAAVLLMVGLSAMAASHAALPINAEAGRCGGGRTGQLRGRHV